MRVLIDAVNVTAAGPLAVVRSLIPELLALPDLTCTGLVADGPLADLAWPDRLTVVPRRRSGFANRVSRVVDAASRVPATAADHRADVILTLGDIGAIRGATPTVLFVHNALMLSRRDGLTGAVQRSVFARSLARAARVVVQTPIMAAALSQRYGLPAARIRVASHPSPSVPEGGQVPEQLCGPSGKLRLLYLAAYYPHKRHDLLRDIARNLRLRGLEGRVALYITLADGTATRQLLDVTRHESSDLIANLGHLTQADAAAALGAVDGLLHLSDAESYGMTLLEAMRASRTVIAPDLPYARWACGDAAHYFAAGDAAAAAEAIAQLVCRSDADAPQRAARADALRKFLPSWADVAQLFRDELRVAIDARAQPRAQR